MFLIIEGLAEVLMRPEPGSKDVPVVKLKPGDFIDDLCALTGEGRHVTSKAVTDLLVYEISKDDLLPIIKNRPEIADNIAEIITQKRNVIDQKLIEYDNQKFACEDKVTLGRRIKDFFLSFLRD